MKRNKGITLIALIITIIVLLILVAVSVQVLIKSNLIGAAEKTTSKYKTAAEEEANGGTIEIGGKKYDSIEDYVPDGEVNWEKILEEANANPEKWRHPDQSSTNKDIGIGTDGKPVNLDLWNYIIIDTNQVSLGTFSGCNGIPGYQSSNIIDGKIQGTVPQYIYIDEKEEIYTVTNMYCTFYYCTNLIIAPKIPSSVINMDSAFYECSGLTTAPEIPSGVVNMDSAFHGCSSLSTAPEIPVSVINMGAAFWGCKNLIKAPNIPSNVTDIGYAFTSCSSLVAAPDIPASVKDMNYTFYGCNKLEGTMRIDANPTRYENFFYFVATEGAGLVVTGSSDMLNQIISTGSSTSKITKGQ